MMKYGDKYTAYMRDPFTGKSIPNEATYKRAEWYGYHTNDDGEGLWRGDKQILGTCQFSVAGCQTERTAVAKIRKHVKGMK